MTIHCCIFEGTIIFIVKSCLKFMVNYELRSFTLFTWLCGCHDRSFMNNFIVIIIMLLLQLKVINPLLKYDFLQFYHQFIILIYFLVTHRFLNIKFGKGIFQERLMFFVFVLFIFFFN